MIESVWDRETSSGDQINANTYNAIIGVTLLWGFFINYLLVTTIPAETVASINPLVLILGYFVSCIAGIIIFTKSDNPFVSFLGYKPSMYSNWCRD